MCKIFDEIREEGIEKGIEQGIAKGREEGIAKGRTETATAMIKGGKLSYELISEYSGLTLKEVNDLAKIINA